MKIKKYLTFLLTMAILFSVAGCRNADINDDNVTIYLLEKVIETSDNQRIPRYEYEYDSRGNLLKKISYSDGEEFNRWEYKYDSSNHKIECSYYYKSQKQDRHKYEYDRSGNLIKQIQIYCRNDEEKETYSETFQYDEDGILIEEVLYYLGEESQRTYHTYNNKGALIKEDYEPGGYAEYTYDSMGNLLERIECSQDGKAYARLVLTYDSNANLIDEIRYFDSTTYESIDSFVHWQYEYDKSGNQVKITYDGYGDRIWCTEYTYSKEGYPETGLRTYNDGSSTNHMYQYKKITLDLETAKRLRETLNVREEPYADPIMVVIAD